jgi:hypothetical protein
MTSIAVGQKNRLRDLDVPVLLVTEGSDKILEEENG